MSHQDHTHTMPDGTVTGLQIIDPMNGDLHWHLVGEVRTEGSKPFGPEHTHVLDGAETSLQELKSTNTDIETKTFGHQKLECKEEVRNGVKVGIIAGYLATWDLDRGAWGVKDRFERGAFLESIADHQAKGRPARFKDHHERIVGGFPADTLKEDEIGLFGRGEVNLEVQQGREAFSLAKQGVLSDFSVGFSSLSDTEITEDEQRIRVITKATLWEGSIVGEPMNPKAKITEVKSVVPFQDLKMAERDTAWDGAKAAANISSVNISNPAERKKAFLWSDDKKSQLQIADVIDGNLVAIPKAIFMAASAIENGSTSIPESDQGEVKKNIEGYYEKMGLPSPFGEKKSFSVELTTRNIEKAMKCYGFSKSIAKSIASQVKVDKSDDDTQNDGSQVILKGLKSLMDTLKSPA